MTGNWRIVGAVLAVLAVFVLAGCGPEVTAGPAPTPTNQSAVPTTPAPTCPPGLIPAQISPPDRSTVRVRVLNGSGRTGVETAVAGEFGDRGLRVVGTGPAPEPYPGVVILRYGAQAVGAAWDLEPFFRIGLDAPASSWRDDFQLGRTDDVVDVVLGRQFQQLATTTEVNQGTAHLGLPTAPPGTCALPHGN